MPPLLAALLMLELGCQLSIIQAIDLSMEWRKFYTTNDQLDYSEMWYAGWLALPEAPAKSPGTLLWPWTGHRRRTY